MRIDRKQMKAEAHLAMREQRRPSIYLITLVFLLICVVLGVLSMKLAYPGVSLKDIYAYTFSDIQELSEYLRQAASNRSVFSQVLEWALIFMSAVINLGFIGVCLSVSRRMATGFGSLFDTFGFFFKVFWLNIVTGIFICLWTILFVIPGIVAAYRYSMASYVLLDDPDRSVMDCIRESKRLTAGHKGELFVLHLSFLGWSILSAIPFVSLYTVPYIEVTTANYYNVLSGYQPTRVENLETPQDDGWWS